MRAVPEERLAATQIESYVLLCVLPVPHARDRCYLYYSFTRGKTTLGPRAFSAKFIILIGWVSCFFLRSLAREETTLTSLLAGTHARHDHILERHRHALQFLYDL